MENHREDPKSLPRARKGIWEAAPSPVPFLWGLKAVFLPAQVEDPACSTSHLHHQVFDTCWDIGKMISMFSRMRFKGGEGLVEWHRAHSSVCAILLLIRDCIFLGWFFLVFPFFFLYAFGFVFVNT